MKRVIVRYKGKEDTTPVDTHFTIIRSDKRGHIDKALPPILARLQITADQWRINTTQFEAIHPRRFNRLTPQLDSG